MSHHQAAVYRQRAGHLRTLASELAHTPSMSLHLQAGVDTWYGPRPDACAADLALALQAVRGAIDDLNTQAFAFDRRADELDAAAFRAQHQLEVETRP